MRDRLPAIVSQILELTVFFGAAAVMALGLLLVQ
jgi:hypothetical protein